MARVVHSAFFKMGSQVLHVQSCKFKIGTFLFSLILSFCGCAKANSEPLNQRRIFGSIESLGASTGGSIFGFLVRYDTLVHQDYRRLALRRALRRYSATRSNTLLIQLDEVKTARDLSSLFDWKSAWREPPVLSFLKGIESSPMAIIVALGKLPQRRETELLQRLGAFIRSGGFGKRPVYKQVSVLIELSPFAEIAPGVSFENVYQEAEVAGEDGNYLFAAISRRRLISLTYPARAPAKTLTPTFSREFNSE